MWPATQPRPPSLCRFVQLLRLSTAVFDFPENKNELEIQVSQQKKQLEKAFIEKFFLNGKLKVNVLNTAYVKMNCSFNIQIIQLLNW